MTLNSLDRELSTTIQNLFFSANDLHGVIGDLFHATPEARPNDINYMKRKLQQIKEIVSTAEKQLEELQ